MPSEQCAVLLHTPVTAENIGDFAPVFAAQMSAQVPGETVEFDALVVFLCMNAKRTQSGRFVGTLFGAHDV